MARTKSFTEAQVKLALADAGGSVAKAALSLGCSTATIYNYVGRKRRGGRASSVEHAIEAEIRIHEAKIVEIQNLRAELSFHEEQIERLRIAQGVLNPQPTPPKPLTQSVA
jgi:transposase